MYFAIQKIKDSIETTQTNYKQKSFPICCTSEI